MMYLLPGVLCEFRARHFRPIRSDFARELGHGAPEASFSEDGTGPTPDGLAAF